jgi:hypothetical protein
MKRLSIPFFFGSYVAAILVGLPFTIGPLITSGGRIDEEHLPFIMIGTLPALYALVIFAILVYRIWQFLPPSYARTTPGKAVGFLFIPLFNLYWYFEAVYGWAKDFNAYVQRENIQSPRVSEAVALATAVFAALSGALGAIAGFAQAPALGTIVGAPLWILMPLFIYQACTAVNSLPLEAADSAPGSLVMEPLEVPSPPRGFGIASLVLGILSIILPYIGLVLGIIGIVLAAKQRSIYKEPFSLAGQITSIIGTAMWGLTTLILLFVLANA